jgi:peptide/nickel transport system ATP-binding protein
MHAPDRPILRVDQLKKLYPIEQGIIGSITRKKTKYVHAIDGVSFEVKQGQILGLVGESGSGKTTTARCVLGLVDPTEGEVIFNGQNVSMASRGKDRLLLRRQIQMIFQDPYESLNPRQTVFQIISEPLNIHFPSMPKNEVERRVASALEVAGLRPPRAFYERYPEELSGGQRQRIVIAGALVLNPQMLVADEPVSMLDVSIRAGVLNLLKQLRDENNISILYITHDLATTSFITDQLAVMYLGKIVEIGPTTQVLGNPCHPYTKALISVIPTPNPRRRKERVILQGEIPNPIDIPSGCRFHPRCPSVFADCQTIEPDFRSVSNDHRVCCLLYPDDRV